MLRGQKRMTSDELIGGGATAAGLAARGGLGGALAGAVLMPIAEAAGHKLAQLTGLEKDPEDK
jgi:hypothetical protein